MVATQHISDVDQSVSSAQVTESWWDGQIAMTVSLAAFAKIITLGIWLVISAFMLMSVLLTVKDVRCSLIDALLILRWKYS